MKYSIMVIAASAALTGCAADGAGAALDIQDPTVLARGFSVEQSTRAGAATDAWIARYGSITGASLDAVARRLDAMRAVDADAYFGTKAQCWVNAAREERSLHDGWGFVEEATREAMSIADGLEGRTQLIADNPKLRTSVTVRPDLWQQLENAKASPHWQACPAAQPVVACAEVGLIHAGHEAWTHAYRAAQQRVAAIEQQTASLPTVLAACAPPPPPPAPVPPKISLPTDTLFRFDRSDVDGMQPRGREQLDQLARDVLADTSVTSIHADGYTDRIGSDRHNLPLSQRRADTVLAYLRERGVTLPMTRTGHGKADPVVECSQHERLALIDCLEPNRRVELTFARAEQDAQDEQDGHDERQGHDEPQVPEVSPVQQLLDGQREAVEADEADEPDEQFE